MSRTIATLQVRMGSERLPGKHLRDVCGKPLLWHLLNRVSQATTLDGLVVAMPATSQNDVLDAWCREQGYKTYRGPEDDVLGRMLGALEQEGADVGVEIYGDGTLIDPRLIDQMTQTYRDGAYDFVGNDLKHTFPSGMFVEAFSMDAFRDSAKQTSDPAIREHGTLFLRQHPDRYRLLNIEAEGTLKRPDLHFDVDTQEDLGVIAAIVEHFSPRTDFSLQEIIAFIDAHPEISAQNAQVHRRWKQYQPDA